MKFLPIISLVFLAGCCTPSTVPKWPDAPPNLKQPAPELVQLKEDQRKLSDLIQNANDNYTKYHQLKNSYEAWQKWYDEQKKIYTDTVSKLK
ncbi:MAG TPA: hypothetical protein VFM18_18530 [Methanosarcina sp.]|nr:hypothetical protein [Methanosarcina sp.]